MLIYVCNFCKDLEIDTTVKIIQLNITAINVSIEFDPASILDTVMSEIYAPMFTNELVGWTSKSPANESEEAPLPS